MGALKLVILTLVFIVLFMLLAVKYARTKVLGKLYHPTRHYVQWSSIDVPRDIYISTRSGQWSYDRPLFEGDNIHVWHGDWFARAPCVLHFHGNSLNISYREYMANLCIRMRLNLLLVDYRGYGKSEGTPSSKKILGDAETAMNFLLGRVDCKDIIVWGESLGGSPACHVASRYGDIKALVLFSTFTSLHDLLRIAPSAATALVYKLARVATKDINSLTNNLGMVSKCARPVLVVHSEEDSLIPYNCAVRLHGACRNPRSRLLTIKGDHDSPQLTSEQLRFMVEFLTPLPPTVDLSEAADAINSIADQRDDS